MLLLVVLIRKQYNKTMRKELSIIIPFCGQTVEDLAKPLGSINNQIGIDFKAVDIHLINDGGQPINLEKLKIFDNLNLNYHELKVNQGAGMARQYGINHSEGEYIFFLDADDFLFLTDGLYRFFWNLSNAGAQDFFVASYVRIGSLAGQPLNLIGHPADRNDPSVCGKFYRRAYLDSLDIRFSEKLRVFEDAYFNRLVAAYTDKVVLLADTPIFCYTYSKDSVTHQKGVSQVMEQGVKAMRLDLEKFKELGKTDFKETLESYFIGQYLFAKLNIPIHQKEFELELTKMIKEFPEDWDGYSPHLQTLAETFLKTEKFKMINDISDLADFVNKIEQISV